jgi:hypothetical protein
MINIEKFNMTNYFTHFRNKFNLFKKNRIKYNNIVIKKLFNKFFIK